MPESQYGLFNTALSRALDHTAVANRHAKDARLPAHIQDSLTGVLSSLIALQMWTISRISDEETPHA